MCWIEAAILLVLYSISWLGSRAQRKFILIDHCSRALASMMCRSLKLDFKSSTCLFTCVLIVLYFWGVVIVLLLLGFCWFDLVWVFSPHSLALSYCLLMHHCYNTKIATSQDLFQWHKKEAAA